MRTIRAKVVKRKSKSKPATAGYPGIQNLMQAVARIDGDLSAAYRSAVKAVKEAQKAGIDISVINDAKDKLKQMNNLIGEIVPDLEDELEKAGLEKYIDR